MGRIKDKRCPSTKKPAKKHLSHRDNRRDEQRYRNPDQRITDILIAKATRDAIKAIFKKPSKKRLIEAWKYASFRNPLPNTILTKKVPYKSLMTFTMCPHCGKPIVLGSKCHRRFLASKKFSKKPS